MIRTTTDNNYEIITIKKSNELKNMAKILKVKERVERQMKEDNLRYKECIADMFLAGPLAWPDYPECDDMDWEEDEEWIPLSSAGE